MNGFKPLYLMWAMMVGAWRSGSRDARLYVALPIAASFVTAIVLCTAIFIGLFTLSH